MTAPSTSAASTSASELNGAAPVMRSVVGQTKAELTMTLRRGESVLVTIIMPVILLVFFGSILPVPKVAGKAINFLLPGIVAVAIISTGMVSLGIATAYERYYGVLKRLGSSPLPRWGLIVAKLISVLALEVVQVVLLVGIAIALFGWRPTGGAWAAVPIALLGTVVFAGLGMLMAGALRAEATLAGANGLYVVFLAIGGIFVPTDHFPGPIAAVCNILPPAALSDSLRGTLTSQGAHAGSVLLLIAWGVIILIAAARYFKWE